MCQITTSLSHLRMHKHHFTLTVCLQHLRIRKATSIRQSIRPPIRPLVRPWLGPSGPPSIRLSVLLSDRPSVRPSVRPCVQRSVCPSTCPSAQFCELTEQPARQMDIGIAGVFGGVGARCIVASPECWGRGGARVDTGSTRLLGGVGASWLLPYIHTTPYNSIQTRVNPYG